MATGVAVAATVITVAGQRDQSATLAVSNEPDTTSPEDIASTETTVPATTVEVGESLTTDGLGRMYKPVYFNAGIAIYGASNVPNQPSSHGGVKIPMHIAEDFGDLVHEDDVVFVFDGVKEPETHGGGPPPFDDEITTPALS